MSIANVKTKEGEYELFCEWSARPRMYRVPNTQEEWGELNNVSHSTLARWKKDPKFKSDVRRYMDQWAFSLVPEMVASLHAKGMVGDVKAIEVFLDHFDEHQQKRKGDPDTPEEKEASNMRDALVEAYKARQIRKANAKQTEHNSVRPTPPGSGGVGLPGK